MCLYKKKSYMTIVIELHYLTIGSWKMFNISDLSRYVSPFRFGDTFYVHLIAPDNKVTICIPLNIVDCEDSDIEQILNCYFALFHHIQILQDTFISSITSENRPITLLISTDTVYSLNEVVDDLQDEIEEVDNDFQYEEDNDLLKEDLEYLEYLEDLEQLEEVEGEIDDTRDLIKEGEVTLRELRNELKEGFNLLKTLKQEKDLQDLEQFYEFYDLKYQIQDAMATLKQLKYEIQERYYLLKS